MAILDSPMRTELDQASHAVSAYFSGMRASSCADLGEHGLDLTDEDPEVLLDLFQRPGRDVAVEVAGEGDLVADLGLVVVDPGVGDVRQDFAGEVLLDVLGQRARSRCRAAPGRVRGCPWSR